MSRILALVGPTATGKSRVALELAQRLGGEIVNADALQVYRGFDVGTAKPTAGDRRRVRHHLLDILEPDEPFSAGRFARLARSAIDEIEVRGKVPLVVGGSGFYLRALIDGISPLPSADRVVRGRLRERLEHEGLAVLRDELTRLDPATARRLAPGDTQRTLRALEVALATGRPLSEWVRERPFGDGGVPALKIGLTLPRGVLYDRIAVRIGRMVRAGWVQEVARLLDQGLATSLPAFQAIGYRQIARHVRGECTLETAMEEILRATRRYAKRQSTWFRGETDVRWFSSLAPEDVAPGIIDYLHQAGSRWLHG